MVANKSRNRLCRIMENITAFEFRTSDALQLKQDLRQWYYGGRGIGEADKLVKRFNRLFSGSVILDASGDLLWSLVDESPLELNDSLSRAMAYIPRRQIIGRSIRAYEVAAAPIQKQLEKWQRYIAAVLEGIDQQLRQERTWRETNRMSLPSALVSLAGILSLVLGVLFLIPVVRLLLMNRSLNDTAVMFPSTWEWGLRTTQIFLAVFTIAMVCLLVLLPRMAMTLCSGLFWALYHKGRYNLRRRRLNKFKRAVQEEGFGGYCEKLQAAAQQLADLPPDAPENRDPSCALLGRSGMDQVFLMFSLKPISRGRSCKRFYKRVEKRHVRSRAWIVIFCAALVILRDLMLTGPITECLQGLIQNIGLF